MQEENIITYSKLKKGYILKRNDKVCLYSYKYRVAGAHGMYWLHCLTDDCNAVLFTKCYGMSNQEKTTWVNKFGGVNTGDKSFPEFDSAEGLTRFVLGIYNTSPYKIGDQIMPIPRLGSPCEFPFSYTDEMASYAGKVYIITDINPTTNSLAEELGDPHSYELNTPGDYFWHSSMFMRVASAYDPASASDKTFACHTAEATIAFPDDTGPVYNSIDKRIEDIPSFFLNRPTVKVKHINL